MSSGRVLSAIQKQKIAFRQSVYKEVALLSAEQKQKESAQIVDSLLRNEHYIKSKSISIYISTEDEVDTKKIWDNAFATNKICFVPFVAKNEMKMLEVKSLEDLNGFIKNKWNIPEPPDPDHRIEAKDAGTPLDLIIVPGTAFSPLTKDRIGRGKGYYDRYIKGLRDIGQRPRLMAFSVQIQNSIPTAEKDEKVDEIIYVGS